MRYSYDNLNRLAREDIAGRKTIVYGYDTRGNRTSKKEYAYTTGTLGTLQNEIGYGYSGDRLTQCGGEICEYDANGNPTIYCGKMLGWTRGRLLASYGTATYAYNAAGQRTSKTANGRATEYIWSGERLLGERLNNGSWTRYYYDSTGIIGYSVGNVVYTFRKNLQGDITGIYDENGVLFGEYEYDAWGNVLAEKVLVTGMYTPLHNNPIRYRGYYYDLETGLYYLNSRYYDPETGRFLNQDLISYLDPETVNGLNLYSYCGNDPVNYVDPTGHSMLSVLLIALFSPLGGALLQVAISTLSYAGMAIASLFDKDIRDDLNAIGWNPFNTDESAILKSSDKVSFYKGVPVFRIPAGERSGSFGAIFLAKGSGAITLRHERGHNSQLMMMGIANFGLMIGLPSAFEWSNRPYYERPWEITADIFGGVNRKGHSQANINRGYWYLGVAALFGPFAYFFLFGEF